MFFVLHHILSSSIRNLMTWGISSLLLLSVNTCLHDWPCPQLHGQGNMFHMQYNNLCLTGEL